MGRGLFFELFMPTRCHSEHGVRGEGPEHPTMLDLYALYILALHAQLTIMVEHMVSEMGTRTR